MELLGLENRLLSMLKRLEVGRQRVDLAVLFLIPVEALQGNVFPGQLGNRYKRSTRLLGSELLLLLGSELLLPPVLGILELSLESRPLRMLGSKLLLGGELLLLLESKLLSLRSKLLLLLGVLAEGLCCWIARARVALSTPVLCRPVYWKWGREWF